MASSYEWSLSHSSMHCHFQEVAGVINASSTQLCKQLSLSFQIEHTMLTQFHAKLLQNQLQISYYKRQMHKGLGTCNSSTRFIWFCCWKQSQVGQVICFQNISETCARHLLSYLRLVAGTWLPPEHVAEVAIGPSVTQLFTCNVLVLALHSCSHVMYLNCLLVHTSCLYPGATIMEDKVTCISFIFSGKG